MKSVFFSDGFNFIIASKMDFFASVGITNRVSVLQKIFIIFLALFLASCSTEYGNYHANQTAVQSQTQIAQKTVQRLSSANVPPASPNYVILPNKTQIANLANTIQNAKKRVWVEMYILTEKNIIAALVSAKTKGTDVKVILEPGVFGSTKINSYAFDTLSGA